MTSDNLPHDYREQFLRIIDEMKAAGVTHNDLKYEAKDLVNISKPTGGRTWRYKNLEIYVKHGRLGLIDFNMVTINQSWSCRDAYGATMVGHRVPRKSHRRSSKPGDAFALEALDKLHERGLSLE